MIRDFIARIQTWPRWNPNNLYCCRNVARQKYFSAFYLICNTILGDSRKYEMIKIEEHKIFVKK